MIHRGIAIFAALAAFATVFWAWQAQAADTTETFDPGASDFEFYLNFDGLGKDKYEKEISAEALAGFGIMDRFSAYLAFAGASNEYFGDGAGSASLGLFGTPLDTDHLDLDLFLDASFGASDFAFTPALELNLDVAPDLAVAGFYLRAAEVFAGRDETPEPDAAPLVCEQVENPQGGPPTLICEAGETEEPERELALAPATELTFGAYWTVADGHQLLVEYDMAAANNPAEDEDVWSIGGVALGYNVAIHDSVEMANQLFFDIPQADETFGVGVGVGFIFSLPPAGGTAPEEPEAVAAPVLPPAAESPPAGVDLFAAGWATLAAEPTEAARFYMVQARQKGERLELYGKVDRKTKVCTDVCYVHASIAAADGRTLLALPLPYADRGRRVKGWSGAHFRARLPLVLPKDSIVTLTFHDAPLDAATHWSAPEGGSTSLDLPPDLFSRVQEMLRLDDYSRFERAEVDCLAAHFQKPDDTQIAGWLAQLYVAWNEQIVNEVRWLSRKLESPIGTAPETTAQLRAVLAHRQALNDYVRKSAWGLSRALVEANPNDYIGHRVQADLYRLAGDKEKMDAEIAAVEKLNPDSVGLLFLKGAAKAQFEKDYAAAIAFYDLALARDPQFAKALFFKGLALHALGKEAEARQTMNEVLRLSPKHPGARVYLAPDEYLAALGREGGRLIE
ncbi:MAG: hypothetical protein C4523_17130 [Myxococcales bacterium]|nr:MAG: hypothetical protein C4523_17130 [Myxococcales bacterium]